MLYSHYPANRVGKRLDSLTFFEYKNDRYPAMSMLPVILVYCLSTKKHSKLRRFPVQFAGVWELDCEKKKEKESGR